MSKSDPGAQSDCPDGMNFSEEDPFEAIRADWSIGRWDPAEAGSSTFNSVID